MRKQFKNSFLKKLKQVFINHRENIFVIIFFLVSSLAIFNGVLSGFVISNGNYLYSFEPWIYYREDGQGNANNIGSDQIDWPNIFYFVDELREGNIPLWQYHEQLGNAGIQISSNLMVHPLRIFCWVIFGVPIGWTLEILTRFTLGGFFSYLFLKKLKINKYIAIAFSVGFIFSSSNISSYRDAFATIPLAMPMVYYFTERMITSNRWKDSLWLLLSYLYTVFIGVPHILFFNMFWYGIYLVARLIFIKKFNKALLVKFVVSGILSILIFCVSLLPTIEYFTNSVGINLDYRSNYGLRQLDINSIYNLFFANIFGHPLSEAKRWIYGSYVNSSVFVGFLVPLSILTGGILRLVYKRKFHIIYFFIANLFILLVVYRFPFEHLEQLTNHIPLFHLNSPTYQKTALQLYLTVLGALGFDYIWKLNFAEHMFKRIYVLCISILFPIFAIYKFITIRTEIDEYTGINSEYLTAYFKSVLLVIGIYVIFMFILLHKEKSFKHITNFINDWVAKIFKPGEKGRKQFFKFLGVLVISTFLYEAIIHTRDWVPYSKPQYWFPDVEMTDSLKENIGYSRTISLGRGPAVPETLAAYGIPVAAGRGPVKTTYRSLLQTAWPKIYSDHPTQTFFDQYETDLNSQIWDLVDVKYFIGSKNIDTNILKEKYGEGIEVHKLNDSTLIENTPNPSHAWLVPDGVVFKTDSELVEKFTTDWDIYKDVAFFSEDSLLPGDSPDDESKDEVGKVVEYNQQTNKINIKVSTNGPSYLIISSNYYKGWKATINGQNAKILPAYGFLDAIQIPDAGEYEVEMRFMPDSLVYGAIISILGIISASIFYFVMIRKKNN